MHCVLATLQILFIEMRHMFGCVKPGAHESEECMRSIPAE